MTFSYFNEYAVDAEGCSSNYTVSIHVKIDDPTAPHISKIRNDFYKWINNACTHPYNALVQYNNCSFAVHCVGTCLQLWYGRMSSDSFGVTAQPEAVYDAVDRFYKEVINHEVPN